jgi:putative PIN family toxin of toxin-antitoxin system
MPLPKLVLDTNVIVSAHLKPESLERSVLKLALAGRAELFLSAAIWAEYSEVLVRPKFKIDPDQVAESLALIKAHAKRVTPARTLSVSPDPEDNKFLECADEAGADYLVTGNKRHFPKAWGSTRVVNARELIELLAPELLPGRPDA